MLTCNNGINIPILDTDPCNGDRTPAQCVIDPTVYAELGLSANSTQQQINQALYLALLNLRAQIENL